MAAIHLSVEIDCRNGLGSCDVGAVQMEGLCAVLCCVVCLMVEVVASEVQC